MIQRLVSSCCLTRMLNKLRGLNPHTYSLTVWRSVSLGLTSRCQQGCIPFGGSKGESTYLLFPTSRDHPNALICSPFLYLQSLLTLLPPFPGPLSWLWVYYLDNSGPSPLLKTLHIYQVSFAVWGSMYKFQGFVHGHCWGAIILPTRSLAPS